VQHRPIITIRRFIAAAAAAAILVSFTHIYRDVSSMFKPGVPQAAPAYRQAVRLVPLGPAGIVALAPTPGARQLDVVFDYMETGSAAGEPAVPTGNSDLIRTTSSGINVPVRNAFYDCKEAGCWW
jgi:hypothetical protein